MHKCTQFGPTDNLRRQASWRIFFTLFVVFWFAQPFDIFYSVKYLDRTELLENVAAQTAQVQSVNVGRRVALGILSLFALVALRGKRTTTIRRRTALGSVLVMFLGWAVCSSLWADDVVLTLKRL